MACLDAQQVTAFLTGASSAAERESAQAHLSTCPACRAQVESKQRREALTLAGSPPDGVARQAAESGAGPEPLLRGTAIGRYLVHARVGVGGMGEVYAAVDPELGRKVAIKLVSASSDGSTGGSGSQMRLLREAQAMAQLSHPSVVTVFDVGTFQAGVFLAMELVEGPTLHQWLRQQPRTLREVLALFREAGEGLAAAHAAGLVHRDFKPDNVLVNAQGHARVTDFGLARAARATADEVTSPMDPEVSRRLSDHVTRAGDAVGTLAYMPPEQFEGRAVDGRTDQFAFCVALYRALYDAPPYPGKGSELAANVRAGKLSEPPADKKVPAWLRAVVLKGLSVEPDARHPSMGALLKALQHDPTARRGEWMGALAGGLVLALLAGGIAVLSASDAQVCSGGEAKWAAVWNDGARTALQSAFAATKKAYAGDAAKAVGQTLDARGQAWLLGYAEACQATHLRREQSPEVLELRLRCLEERLVEQKALLALFAAADDTLVRKALQAVSGLESPAACADVQALQLPLPLPSDPPKRARAEALRTSLSGPRALWLAGRFDEGAQQVAPLRAEAEALAWLPLVAEALELEGKLLSEAGKGNEAVSALLRAMVAAEGSRHDEVRARAAIALTSAVGVKAGDSAQGERWGQLADGALRRVGQPDALVGELWSSLGAMSDARGDNDEALRRYETSLAARQRAYGPDSYLVGYTLNNVGITLLALNELTRAEAALERALALQRAGLGDEHPSVVNPLTNLGTLRVRQGKPEAGLAFYEQATALAMRSLGPGHPKLAIALGNVAEALVSMRRWREAEARAAEAVAIFDARFPAGHPVHVYLLATRGEALLELGRAPEALAALERGAGVLQTTQLPPEVGARLRYLLARALLDTRGDATRAAALAQSARAGLPPRPTDPALPAAMDALLQRLGVKAAPTAPR